jgi:hypothetical protein
VKSKVRAAVVGALVLSGEALGHPADPTIAQERRIGRPPGYASVFRLDAARTGQTRSPLPRKPKALWRARIADNIDLAPAVDEKSAIVVAGASSLTQLSSAGKLEWSLRLPHAAPVSGPILTSGGSRVILNSDGELLTVSRSGDVSQRVQLPFNGIRSAAPALPLHDGGLLLAIEGEVLRLDASGSIRAATRVNDEVRTLIQGPKSFLVVTEFGDVHEWVPPQSAVKRGNFGGRASQGAALSGPTRLSAVIDHTQIVDFDFFVGARRQRARSSTWILHGPPTITPAQETRILTSDGMLLGHTPSGRETLRVLLEAAGGAKGPPAPASTVSAAPPLIVDRSGFVALARPSFPLAVVNPTGEVVSAEGVGCADPIAVVPAGAARLLLACRSGQLWMAG